MTHNLATSFPFQDQKSLSSESEHSQEITSHINWLSHETAKVDGVFSPTHDSDKLTECFFELMIKNNFLPSPNILQNPDNSQPIIFTDTGIALFDDLDQIYKSLKQTSIYLQNNIQVAIDFSQLRANRQSTSASQKQTLGPVRFMELFEKAPQQSNRPTSMRFLLNLDHLNIEEYLDYIQTKPENIRFAIGIPNTFITALSRKEKFGLKHQTQCQPTHWVDAIKLFHKVTNIILKDQPIDLIFTDRLNAFKKTHQIDESTVLNFQNQLVSPHEFMSSGVVNLAQCLEDSSLNENKLSSVTQQAIHFLENSFERNHYVEGISKDITLTHRRIGLSVLGLHQVIKTLNPEQGHKKTTTLLTSLAKQLKKEAAQASHDLGVKRGFKSCVLIDDKWQKTRNAQLLSQLHCPTISQMAHTPNYLFKHNMNLDDYSNLYNQHIIWQEQIDNLVSLKQPSRSELDLDIFVRLFFQAFEKGLMSFEINRE